MTAEALGGSNPAASSSSLWASPCASRPRPRHIQEPRGHFARSLPSRVWARFRSQWAARGLGPQPQHPSQLCASENGLPSPGPTPSARRLPSSLHTAPRLPSSGGQAPSRQSPAWPFPWGASAPWLGAWWRGRPPLQLCLCPACPPPAPRRPHPGALVQAVSPGLRPSPLSVPDSASISKGSAERLSHRWHLQESPWRQG